MASSSSTTKILWCIRCIWASSAPKFCGIVFLPAKRPERKIFAKQAGADGGGGRRKLSEIRIYILEFGQRHAVSFDFLVERAARDSQSFGRPLDIAVLLSEGSRHVLPLQFQEAPPWPTCRRGELIRDGTAQRGSMSPQFTIDIDWLHLVEWLWNPSAPSPSFAPLYAIPDLSQYFPLSKFYCGSRMLKELCIQH